MEIKKTIKSLFLALFDLSMLMLAIISISLLVVDEFYTNLFVEYFGSVEKQHITIIYIDWIICGIFWIEYIVRLMRVPGNHLDKFFHILKTWYDILGMIPLSNPAVRFFRVFRIIRIVSSLRHSGKIIKTLTYENIIFEIINKYKNVLIEIVSDAIIIKILNIAQSVLEKGQYRDVFKKVLEEKKPIMNFMIKQNIENNPTWKKLEKLPMMGTIKNTIIEEATDVSIKILSSPEFEDVIKTTICEVIVSMKKEVAKLESLGEKEQNVKDIR